MAAILSIALERQQAIGRDVPAALPNVLSALIVVLILWGVAQVVRGLVQRVWGSREGNLGRLLGRLASGSTLVLGVLVGLTIVFPSVTPASLSSLLGVGGVAIGFAFRDILQNLLAGILLLTRPFRIGDQIVTGDSEGTAEDIQMRATILRPYDNLQVVIPDADLFTGKVIVKTAYDMRRLQYDVGIGYGDDIAQAKQVIHDTLAGLSLICQEPAPAALVVELAERSVNLRVRWGIDSPRRKDALDHQDEVLEQVKAALQAPGGDRAWQREGWPAGAGAVPAARAARPAERGPS